MNRSPLLVSRAFVGLVRSSSRISGPAAGRVFQQSLQSSGSLFPSWVTSRPFSSDQAPSLSDLLARELAEEKEDGRDVMPEELVELKTTIEKDWKIVDEGATARLHRTVGATKIVVSFHCQDTVENAEEEAVEDEAEEAAMPFRFEILISKAGNTLLLNCLTSGAETTVDGALTSTEDIDTILANGIGRLKYQGPEFSELAEDLQDAFQEFVFADLGLNEDVSAFISMYADYMEQVQYIGFLKAASKVLP